MTSRGERLKHALAARGIHKQMALAVQLGVDESAISRWQRDAGLSLTHAARLCEALDISLDWLILDRGDMDLHNRPDPSCARQKPLGEFAFLPPSLVEAFSALAVAVNKELGSHSDP